MKLKFGFVEKKGGTGSGHHGHAGRPGKHGGSLPGSGGGSDSDGWTADELKRITFSRVKKKIEGVLPEHSKFRSYQRQQGYFIEGASVDDLKAKLTPLFGKSKGDTYNFVWEF